MQLNAPLDMHLHLRDGEMLKNIAKSSANTFSGAIIMPNLVPPVSSKEEVVAYKQRIMDAIGDEKFTPYMTLFFKPSYDKAFLESVKDDITAIKLYPAGITTNSEGGVSGFDVEELRPALEAMSELDIPLCVHGETNGFVMDREAEFVSIYEKLATAFPDLKIIMEHITTKESVEALDKFENLYATITLHHLIITLDDVAGGMLKPHLFCKPIAKRPEDRSALLKVALKHILKSCSVQTLHHIQNMPKSHVAVRQASLLHPSPYRSWLNFLKEKMLHWRTFKPLFQEMHKGSMVLHLYAKPLHLKKKSLSYLQTIMVLFLCMQMKP